MSENQKPVLSLHDQAMLTANALTSMARELEYTPKPIETMIQSLSGHADDLMRASSQSDPLPTAASGPQLCKEVLAMLGEFADNPEILFYNSTLCWYCCGPYALNAHEPGCLVVRARVACGLPIHYEEGRGYVEKGGRLPDAAGKVTDTAITETPEGLK